MTATATAAIGGTAAPAAAARRSAVRTASRLVLKRLTRLRRPLRLGIKPEAEAVGHPGQVIEDADDVADLEERLLVEAELAERLPILVCHPGRRGRQLLGHGAEGTLAS